MNEITLINYQAHKRSVIKLAKTITSIIGRSDHGKSTIIRAIEFVRANRPNGTNFIRKGTNTTKVGIDKVTHIRTLTKNEYRIEGLAEPLKALKQAVPEQVTAALNLSEDNIQEQQGAIFLLQATPGKVAEKLSSLIDVEDAKATLSHVRNQRALLKDKYNIAKKGCESAEKAIQDLNQYIEIDKELTLIEQKRAKVNELKARATKLQQAIQTARKWSDRLSKMPDTSALEPAKEIVREYKAIMELDGKCRRIDRLIQLARTNEWHEEVDINIWLTEASGIKGLIGKHNTIKNLISSCTNLESKQIVLQQKIKKLESEKDKVMGETCPLCGKPQ